ncbi:MAG: class I SAM-dependent methyltransferase [Spirochaetes bacterium]|nr:class I SAM-dependent methyltransferase [Spirochaetota bacterium]
MSRKQETNFEKKPPLIFRIKEKNTIRKAAKVSKSIFSLLNKEYLNRIILANCSFSEGHGARANYLGLGMLYYSFVHLLKAKVAVCLGSGGGFVPRIMRQAQRDLDIEKCSRTIVIDADKPELRYGNPDYLHEGSFLRTLFPHIEIIVKPTKEGACYFVENGIKIDYLHIDADHSYSGSLSDYQAYRPLMADNFIITLHDTNLEGVAKAVEHIRNKEDLEVMDFNYLWGGLAIVKPKTAPDIPISPQDSFPVSIDQSRRFIIFLLKKHAPKLYDKLKEIDESIRRDESSMV